MLYQTDKIEISALKIGVLINFIMAVAGWVAYSLTYSEALLLDGNFSFISAITTIGAILIIRKKHAKTDLFPYGRYFYESFFTLSKGVLILGLTIAALFQNSIKIIDFIDGKEMVQLKTGPILIYMSLMLVLCFGMALFYRKRNKSIDFKSPIIAVETKASFIDGYMTIAVGIALVLTTIVPEDSTFSFLLYIGDAVVVILMCLFLLKIPVEVIKQGFIELGGGSITDKETVSRTKAVLYEYLPEDFDIKTYYISKTGSSYLIIIYVKVKKETIKVEVIKSYRNKLLDKLKNNLSNLELEIILDN